MCPHARGRWDRYTHGYMHDAWSEFQKKLMVGGNMGIDLAELLDLHHGLFELPWPSCWRWVSAKVVGFPKSKAGLRSGLPLAVCLPVREVLHYQEQKTQLKQQRVCWLTGPELAPSSLFLTSRISSVLSRFPMIPMMAAVGSLEGESVSCKSQPKS